MLAIVQRANCCRGRETGVGHHGVSGRCGGGAEDGSPTTFPATAAIDSFRPSRGTWRPY